MLQVSIREGERELGAFWAVPIPQREAPLLLVDAALVLLDPRPFDRRLHHHLTSHSLACHSPLLRTPSSESSDADSSELISKTSRGIDFGATDGQVPGFEERVTKSQTTDKNLGLELVIRGPQRSRTD